MPLPNLILLDDHENPINLRILSKMMFRLKELGYREYFAEQPPGFIMGHEGIFEDVYNSFYEQISPFIKTLKGTLSGLPNDINPEIDELKKIDFQCTPDDLLILANQFDDILQRMDTNYDTFERRMFNYAKSNTNRADAILFVMALKFLDAIKINEIIYTAIDDIAITDIARNDEYSTKVIEEININAERRERTMSNAYLSTKQAVFGTLGQAHLPGIQKLMLEKIALEELQQRFIFLHLSTNQKDDDYVQKLSPKLAPVCIDTRNKSDEEIIEEILQQISLNVEQSKEKKEQQTFIQKNFYTNWNGKAPEMVSEEATSAYCI